MSPECSELTYLLGTFTEPRLNESQAGWESGYQGQLSSDLATYLTNSKHLLCSWHSARTEGHDKDYDRPPALKELLEPRGAQLDRSYAPWKIQETRT